MCKYETRTLVHALPVAHARAWLQRVRMRVTHTAALHSRVCDAHTSLKRGYMYAFVRECTRLAPLMATHCVISTSGRVTPRYKTNDKARQIPLRFESLKSSLVLPVSLGFSDCLSLFPIYHSHSRALSLSLSSLLSLSTLPPSLFLRLFLCLCALPLLAGLCLLPFTVSTLPRIEDTGIRTRTLHARLSQS